MKTLKRWLPALIVCGFIYWLSAQTGTELKDANLTSTNVHIAGHVWMFALLYIACYRGTKDNISAVVLCFFYALFDELHQRFTPGRHSSWYDVTNDVFAASVSSLFIWKFYPKLPKILKNWLEA